MFINKETLINLITKDHVKKICQTLGSDYKTDNQGNLIFNTMICHEDGKSWKLYYYHKPKKRFKCYTCGDSFDLIGLVLRSMKLKGKILTYFQALSFIANQIGYKETEINTLVDVKSKETDMVWINEFQKQNTKFATLKHPTVLNEHILEVFSYVDIPEWRMEGISENAIQKFQIGYWDKHDSITIPHRYYEDGTLIGVKERFLNPDTVKTYGKYVPVTIQGKNLAYRTGLNLYGLYYTKDDVEEEDRIIIFESEKSVLKCEDYFDGKNFSCAACGSHLSKTQIEIIKRLRIKEVILAFDKEYSDPHSFEAEAYKNKLVMMLEPLLNYAECYMILDGDDEILEPKDSPADAGKEGMLKLMAQRYRVDYGMVNEIKNKGKKNG